MKKALIILISFLVSMVCYAAPELSLGELTNNTSIENVNKKPHGKKHLKHRKHRKHGKMHRKHGKRHVQKA